MKKIFILLGVLLLGIISYAKEDDILGTWIMKESGEIIEIYKNKDGEYSGQIKENDYLLFTQSGKGRYDEKENSLYPFFLRFPDKKFSYLTTIYIQKDGSLLLKGVGITKFGKYVGEWNLIREK